MPEILQIHLNGLRRNKQSKRVILFLAHPVQFISGCYYQDIMTWFLRSDSCCSVCVRLKLSLSTVAVNDSALFSNSQICRLKFSTRQLRRWFSASRSLTTRLSRSMSPSSDCRSNSVFVSWFSVSSSFTCRCCRSDSSFASFTFSFSIFSYKQHDCHVSRAPRHRSTARQWTSDSWDFSIVINVIKTIVVPNT